MKKKGTHKVSRVIRPGLGALKSASRVKPTSSVEKTRKEWNATATPQDSPAVRRYQGKK